MADPLKILRVSCAIIEHANTVLIDKRSAAMKHPLKWEFPGGKIEEGESAEDCILREIKEELNIDILIKSKLPAVISIQNGIELHLIPFICQLKQGIPHPKEHEEILWSKKENLQNVDWIEADVRVVNMYLE